MSKILLSLFAAVALSVPSIALACPGHAKGEAGASCASCDKCKSGECPHAKAAKGEGEAGCPHHKNEDHAGKEGDCACGHGKKEKQASAWKEITVEQLASLEYGKVTIFDVNNAKVRGDKGVIPGAVLLSSSSQYDLSVLPKDKDAKLVFYCANTRCTAAPTAAERAIGAGYSDVNVLHVGISGWKEAGKKTDTPRS